jgi:hypothetical protein
LESGLDGEEGDETDERPDDERSGLADSDAHDLDEGEATVPRELADVRRAENKDNLG